MELIKLVKTGEVSYKVYVADNDVYLGDFLMKEDGFYDWWPNAELGPGGFWSAWMLRAMAEKLDELNAPYQAELNAYFEQESNKNGEESQS